MMKSIALRLNYSSCMLTRKNLFCHLSFYHLMETNASPRFTDSHSKNRRLFSETENNAGSLDQFKESATTTATSFANNLLDIALRREGKRSRTGAKDHIDSKSATTAITNSELSNISVSELEKCLEPILLQLQELDAEALLHLTRVDTGGARLNDSAQVRPIHDEIYPPATHDDDEDSTASSSEALPVVRYIHLQEVPDQYSVGIFVFPPYAKIPLHDHPDMCVLSRILYGDLERRSLDLPPPAIDDKDASTVSQKRRAYYRAQKPPRGFNYDRSSSSCSSYDTATASVAATTPPIPVDRLVAPQCTVLYPREGNLHEFVAGPNGAAVLDVLLPPYDADGHRDCTFYEIEYCDDDDVTPPSSTFLGNGDSLTASRTHDSVYYPCWIVPTGQPENFHCISGQYRDLGG